MASYSWGGEAGVTTAEAAAEWVSASLNLAFLHLGKNFDKGCNVPYRGSWWINNG